MAKKSKIVANKKRAKLVEKYREKRKMLRKASLDEKLTDEQRAEAFSKLAKLPVNSAACRFRNRCEITGRTRGHLRNFKMSRIAFRELANRGLIPGVTKSSW